MKDRKDSLFCCHQDIRKSRKDIAVATMWIKVLQPTQELGLWSRLAMGNTLMELTARAA